MTRHVPPVPLEARPFLLHRWTGYGRAKGLLMMSRSFVIFFTIILPSACKGHPCDRVLFQHRRQAAHPHVRHRMSCMAAPFPSATHTEASFLGSIVAVPSTVPTLTLLETTTAFNQIRNRHRRTDLPSCPFLTLPTGTL